MRIVFLSPSAQLGGAERMLVDVLASLRPLLASEDELHVILMADGPLGEVLRGTGATVHLSPMPERMARLGESTLAGKTHFFARTVGRLKLGVRLLGAAWAVSKYVRKLRRQLRHLSPDIIHSNGLKSHILSAWARPKQTQLVWHVHDFIGGRPLAARRLKKFSSNVAAIIAVSNAVSEDVSRLLPPNVRVDVVYNGIDVDHFSPAEPETKTEDAIRIGLIATYARWKGQDVFIKAAAIAKSMSSGLKFELIGSPIYATAGSQFTREELISLSKDSQLTASELSFVDFQADPLLAYRAQDIVVHASTRPEPFGRTIVEAMACGKAVIVARAGGAAELFTDGEDAIGVPPGDADALAKAILLLATDVALRRRIGVAAREIATARFDRQHMGRKIHTIYRSILASADTTG